MEEKYQCVCINLERRPDRKETMTQIFSSQNITNYKFFDAIDGTKIDPNNPLIKFFKHLNTHVLQQGIVGAALSHYHIWNMLVEDVEHKYYIIFEDDVKLIDNFKINLNKILSQMSESISFVFLGTTLEQSTREQTKNIYINNDTFTVHPLNKNIYIGGAFGYIIDKNCATMLIDYVNQNGFHYAVDDIIIKTNFKLHETHPHMVFTDADGYCNHYVDSDIQHNRTKINYDKLINVYLFNDYDFYPNKDSYGRDIKEVYADIPSLKKIADEMENCIAFNSYGWLKHTINDPAEFINLNNKYYLSDGLYVKKSFSITSKQAILD